MEHHQGGYARHELTTWPSRRFDSGTAEAKTSEYIVFPVGPWAREVKGTTALVFLLFLLAAVLFSLGELGSPTCFPVAVVSSWSLCRPC